MDIINSFKRFLNISDAVEDVKCIVNDISEDVKCLKELHKHQKEEFKNFKRKIAKLEEEKNIKSSILQSIVNDLDYLVWAKDLEGKYIMANRVFRERFCYGMKWSDIKGKTDYELIAEFKDKVGYSNHTLGEAFNDSDKIIYDTEEAKEYLEQGKINGEMVKLVINKSPVYDFTGTMFAVSGTARDITQLCNDVERTIKTGKKYFGLAGKKLLLDELEKVDK